MIMANAKVAQTMFSMASSGQHPGMTAMWLKCRMGWKEPRTSTDMRFVDEEGNDRDFSTAKRELAAELTRIAARTSTE
jgi:hypothetical protein